MWVWESVGMWEGREGLMIAHSGFGDRKHRESMGTGKEKIQRFK
jgi:hypothetical protein